MQDAMQVELNGSKVAVGKIVCLARNYLDHIRELGNATPEEPVLFCKPATSLIADGDSVIIPPYSDNCHYEVELALLIGTEGKNIPQEKAFDHIAGYGVAIDMTLRDVQNALKEKGLPWEKAKAFDTACPVSTFVPAAQVKNPEDLGIKLWVNGELKQDGRTSMMMRSIPEMIAAVSEVFRLMPGDLILTGTPAGVGRVDAGDRMRGEIEGVGSLEVGVAR